MGGTGRTQCRGERWSQLLTPAASNMPPNIYKWFYSHLLILLFAAFIKKHKLNVFLTGMTNKVKSGFNEILMFPQELKIDRF